MGIEPTFDNIFKKGSSIHTKPRLESMNLYNPLCQMIVRAVGTGTDMRQGMYRRMIRYRDGACISAEMNEAFQHGYQLTNFRVLCWVNRRAPVEGDRSQHLVLLFEATIMFMFEAMKEGQDDHDFRFAPRLLTGLWEGDVNSDRGLCVVCPLTESGIGAISLEEEEALRTSLVEGQNEECAA